MTGIKTEKPTAADYAAATKNNYANWKYAGAGGFDKNGNNVGRSWDYYNSSNQPQQHTILQSTSATPIIAASTVLSIGGKIGIKVAHKKHLQNMAAILSEATDYLDGAFNDIAFENKSIEKAYQKMKGEAEALQIKYPRAAFAALIRDGDMSGDLCRDNNHIKRNVIALSKYTPPAAVSDRAKDKPAPPTSTLVDPENEAKTSGAR